MTLEACGIYCDGSHSVTAVTMVYNMTFGIQSTEHRIPDTEYRIRDTGKEYGGNVKCKTANVKRPSWSGISPKSKL